MREHAGLQIEEKDFDGRACILEFCFRLEGVPTSAEGGLCKRDGRDHCRARNGLLDLFAFVEVRNHAAGHAVDVDLGHAIEVLDLKRKDACFQIKLNALHIGARGCSVRGCLCISEVDCGCLELCENRLEVGDVGRIWRVDTDANKVTCVLVKAWTPVRGKRGVVEVAFVTPDIVSIAKLHAEQRSLRDCASAEIDGGWETDVSACERGGEKQW